MSEEKMPTTDDVKAFLEGKASDTPVQESPTREIPIPVNKEHLDALTAAGLSDTPEEIDTRNPEERIKINGDSHLMEDNPANRSITIPKIPKEYLELTQGEKEKFVKCVMLDEEVKFELGVPSVKDLKFEVRAKNSYEQSLCYFACSEDFEGKGAANLMDQLNNFRYYSAIMQVCSINGVPSKWHKTFEQDMNLSEHESKLKHYGELRDIRRQYSNSVPTFKWIIYFTILQMFDAKLVLASEGLANSDFFNPVE